jgi:hypothetical protein
MANFALANFSPIPSKDWEQTKRHAICWDNKVHQQFYDWLEETQIRSRAEGLIAEKRSLPRSATLGVQVKVPH